MPAQHRLRSDEQPRPAAAGDQLALPGLQSPVGPGQPRPGDLTAQYRQLVRRTRISASLIASLRVSKPNQPAAARSTR
jgi:hypothetical protein